MENAHFHPLMYALQTGKSACGDSCRISFAVVNIEQCICLPVRTRDIDHLFMSNTVYPTRNIPDYRRKRHGIIFATCLYGIMLKRSARHINLFGNIESSPHLGMHFSDNPLYCCLGLLSPVTERKLSSLFRKNPLLYLAMIAGFQQHP